MTRFVEGKITLDELHHGYLLVRRGSAIIIWSALATAVIAGGFLCAAGRTDLGIQAICGAIGVLLFHLFYRRVMYRMRARRMVRHNHFFNQQMRYSWDDTSFWLNAGDSRISYPWERIRRVREDQRMFLVYPDRYTFLPMPKSWFTSASEIAEFSRRISGIRGASKGLGLSEWPPHSGSGASS